MIYYLRGYMKDYPLRSDVTHYTLIDHPLLIYPYIYTSSDKMEIVMFFGEYLNLVDGTKVEIKTNKKNLFQRCIDKWFR